MNRKFNNDQNIKNLRKRELLRIMIIIFSLLTIIFSFGNLFYNINLIFALFCFALTVILNKAREKIFIVKKEKDELKEIRQEIKNNKKKFKKY